MEPSGGVDQLSVASNGVKRRDFAGTKSALDFVASEWAESFAFPGDKEFFGHGAAGFAARSA
jgi:hypothetical protein